MYATFAYVSEKLRLSKRRLSLASLCALRDGGPEEKKPIDHKTEYIYNERLLNSLFVRKHRKLQMAKNQTPDRISKRIRSSKTSFPALLLLLIFRSASNLHSTSARTRITLTFTSFFTLLVRDEECNDERVIPSAHGASGVRL